METLLAALACKTHKSEDVHYSAEKLLGKLVEFMTREELALLNWAVNAERPKTPYELERDAKEERIVTVWGYYEFRMQPQVCEEAFASPTKFLESQAKARNQWWPHVAPNMSLETINRLHIRGKHYAMSISDASREVRNVCVVEAHQRSLLIHCILRRADYRHTREERFAFTEIELHELRTQGIKWPTRKEHMNFRMMPWSVVLDSPSTKELTRKINHDRRMILMERQLVNSGLRNYRTPDGKLINMITLEDCQIELLTTYENSLWASCRHDDDDTRAMLEEFLPRNGITYLNDPPKWFFDLSVPPPKAYTRFLLSLYEKAMATTPQD